MRRLTSIQFAFRHVLPRDPIREKKPLSKIDSGIQKQVYTTSFREAFSSRTYEFSEGLGEFSSQDEYQGMLQQKQTALTTLTCVKAQY